MHQGTLVIMSRVPRPGATKTRLIPMLGAEGAAELASAFLEDVAARFRDLPVSGRIIAWDGPPRPEILGACAGAFEHLRQPAGDLGERMTALFGGLTPPLVFIGADAPTLPAASVRRAFRLLDETCDVVLQPALDGGFTLGGMRVDPEPFFKEQRWGSATLLEDLLERLRGLPLRAALLEPWYDIDVPADLRRLALHLPFLEGEDGHAPRTAEWLSRILETHA